MSPKIQNSYTFNSRNDWLDYAMAHMKNIEAQQHDNNGTEIWLVRKLGVIGKWSDAINFGYIEEYRDKARLEEDKLTLNS